MHRATRWVTAGVVTVVAFALGTGVTGLWVLPLWMASDADRWVVAAGVGVALAAVAGIGTATWAQLGYRPDAEPAQQELTQDERLALALIMSDPQAAGRGAWLYPLHGDLVNHGLTEAGATSVLQALARRKAIKHVDVPQLDDLTGKADTAPAYQITLTGEKLASDGEVLKLRSSYHYLIYVTGGHDRNKRFLDGLRELDMVQAQTRFITSRNPQSSVIALWSYAPIKESMIKLIGKASGSSVIDIEQSR